MIFSGKNNFRSLPVVVEFSFDSDLLFDNSDGTGSFGFSGSGEWIGDIVPTHENLTFSFKSGKVFDPENNYVFSYQENNPIKISGDVFPNKYIYYINNMPINLSGEKNNFKLQKIFYETEDCSVNSDLNIYIKNFLQKILVILKI